MRLFAVFLILVIACCIHSCKKDNQQIENGIIATDNAAVEIREWLSVQKDDSVAVQKIIVSAQWDKARSIGADSSVYQLVPLSTTNAAKFEADKKIQRYLVLQRQQGAVTGGYIYEMFGSSDDLLKNENELIAGFANKKLNFAFTGNLAKFSLKGAFNESSVYQSGILKQYRKLYKGTTNGTNRIQTTGSQKIAGLQCSDWYLITYYTDGTVTSEYLGRTCYCDDQQQSTALRDTKGVMTIKISCADGGGGGSDPGGDGPCPPQTSQSIKNNKVVLTVKLSSCDIVVYQPDTTKFCDGVTPAQQQAIKNTISAFKSTDCVSKFLYSSLAIKIANFCIGSPSGGAAGYNPVTKAISLTTETADPTFSFLLLHEFFHAYQDDLYPGGTSQYSKEQSPGGAYIAKPGFVNIEFEQIVFGDIVNGSRDAFAFHDGTQEQKDLYNVWINNLSSTGTAYPKLNESSNPSAYNQFISNYNFFLSQYNALPDNPNHSDIVNLTPQSLINLFNNTNPNCP
jgi:hypothetical protein